MVLPFNSEVASAQSFSDVPTSHSNYEDITYLLNEGVIDQSSKFGVSDIVTRAEVAVMIAKAVGLDGTPRATKFSDVPKSNKNSGYIQSAVEAGIINGYDDGTFKPNAKVTRGHMAAFISRAFDLPTGSKSFSDVKKGHTAYEAVSQLAAAGITTGYEDGTFKPSNNLTRAHIAAFLSRAMKLGVTAVETTPTTPAPTPTPVPESKPSVSNNEMKVHFIDVGQGDSTLLQLATGENVLVDAGTDGKGEKVVAYLKSLGVKKLDYVIATHPDADHIGGMVDVINAFTIGTFIDSGKVHTTQTFENMLHAIDKENIKYINPQKGQVFEYDESIESYFQVLHVDANASDNNDASIVIKGGYCNKDLALMGDAGVDIESKILNTFDNLGVEILKAGHHGSNTSSSLEFLKATSPEAVILSYGADNNYGHPHQEVLANIKAIGAKAYSTAQEGTIIATINCEGVKIDSKEFEVPAETVQPKPTPAPQPQTKFNNCEELTKVYPEGVMVGHAAYESKLDRDGDGHACESFENDPYTPPVVTPTPVPTPQPTPEPVQTGFKNCTELRKVYPSGVSSSHPAYESKMDRDGDGYACE